ncbi:hypothetical protein [Burkholderia sp. ABCPW 111]|uniref:hypothetical protein n=1 Tax=Burkholderia sp. ABCPW 111 TaxID=1820025 RepID=UPI000531A503|nr:hypothetical protein [Burkholderia sp. ABCPW 111]KGS08643.1 hypothetical protein X946_217 [Burkholderia sp. ABCPW 111]
MADLRDHGAAAFPVDSFISVQPGLSVQEALEAISAYLCPVLAALQEGIAGEADPDMLYGALTMAKIAKALTDGATNVSMMEARRG